MSSRNDRRAEDGGVQGQPPTVYQYGDENSSVPLADEVEGIKAENLDGSSVEVKKLKKRFLRMFRLGKEKQEAPGEVSMTAPAGDNVDVPTVAADLSAPSATMDDPDASVDVSKPSRDVDTIAEMLSFGGKVEAPTPVVSVDVSAPSADRSGLKGPDKPAVEVPSVDDNVDVSTPDVSVNVSTASVDVGGKMPDVFGGVPDVSAEVPKVDDVGMSAPDVSMSAPGVGVSDDSAKVKDVKVELPDAPSAEGKTPKKGLRRIIDLAKRKLEALEIKGSVPDVKIPEVSGDISAPSASGDVPMPSAHVPSVKAGVSPSPVKGHAPEGGVSVTAPNVRVGVSAPSVDEGVQVPEMPSAGVPPADLPSIGGDTSFSAPGVSMPSVDVDSKAPDVAVDVPAVGGTKMSVDVSAPSVGLGGQVPEMPSASGPSKGMGGKPDVSLDVPAVTGANVSVDVTAPSVDLGGQVCDKPVVSGPSVDPPSVGGDVSVSVPGVSIPLAEVSGKVPDVSVDIPAADEADVSVDVLAPSVLDGKVPETSSVSGPPVDKPSVGGGISVSAPGVSMPSVDMGDKVPDMSVDVPAVDGASVSVPDASVEVSGLSVSAPEASLAAPGVEVSRVAKVDASVPSMEGSKATSDNVTAGVSTEVGGGEVDVKGSEVPSVDVKPKKRLLSRLILFGKGNVEGPNDDVSEPAVEVNVCAPSASVEASAGVSTEVDVKGSEVPSVDVKPKKRLFSRLILFDKGNVEGPNDDVSEPAVEVNVCAPSASVEASGAKSGPEAPGMPSVSAPSVDVPSGVGGDVSVAAPQQSAGVSPPASVDVAGKVAEVSVNVPSVGDVGASALDVSATATDVSSKAPDVSAPGVDASVPQDLKASADNTAAGASMSAKTDDIEVKTPDPSLDAKKPRRPSFLSMLKWSPVIGKIEAADVDVPEPGVEVNVSAPSSTVDVSAPEVSTKAEGETVDADVTEHSPMAVAKPVILGGRRSGGRRVFSKYLGRKNKADASNVTKPDASVTEPDASVSAPDATMSTPTVEVLGAKNVANESASLRISPASKPDTDPEDAKSAEVDSSRLSAVFDAAIGGVDDEDTSGATTESDRVPLPPVPEASPDGDSDLTQKLAAALDAAGVPVDEGQADDEDTDIDVEAPVVPSEDEDHGSVTGGVIGFLFGGGEARHEEGPTEETPAAASEDSTPAAKSVPDVTSPLKESLAGTSRDNDTLTSMFFGSSPEDKMTNEPAAESTSKQSEEDKDNDKNDGGFFGMIAEQLGLIPSNGDEDETAAPAAADADAGATT